MCNSIATPTTEELEIFLSANVNVDDWTVLYHHLSAFSFAKIPVMTQEDQLRVKAFRWGLIPSWCKDETQAKEMRMMTVNARSETIFEKPSFRNSIKDKRCLIFVNGFYEWKEYNKKKYPHFIQLKDQAVFAMGGIYESWVNTETGEIIDSCSIVTTPANELMSEIHNTKLRMPLILPKEKMMRWIEKDLDKEQIQQLMQPLGDGLLEAHTVSKLVTSRTEDNNVPEVKKQFYYSELTNLFG
jgi:putative SOS response-associated peptidase YedK